MKQRPFLPPLMPAFILCTLFISLSYGLSGQITFEQHYGGADDDIGRGVVQTWDEGYLLCGYSRPTETGNYNGCLIRTNSLGDTVWTKSYGGPGNDALYGIIRTGPDTYCVCGTWFHPDSSRSDIWLISLNDNGDTLWSKNSFSATNAMAFTIASSHSGGMILSGYQEDTTGTGHLFLLETDTQGGILWMKNYPFWIASGGNSVIATSDNGYLVCGYADTYALSWNRNLLLLKTDEQGDTLWTKQVGGLAYEMGWSVCEETGGGGYIAAGYSTGAGATTGDAYVVKATANGNLEWFKHLGQSGMDVFYAIQNTTDGHFIATGITAEQGSEIQEAWLVKLNSSGDTLWSSTFGGFRKSYGYCVEETTDLGYIVCGSTNAWGTGVYDIYLVKTDPSGSIIAGLSEAGVQQPPGILFPNPANAFSTVSTCWNHAIIRVFSSQGVMVFSGEAGSGKSCEIPCLNWPSGMYLVRLTNGIRSYHITLIKR